MKRTGKSGWLRRASALLLLLALALSGCAAPAEKTQAEKTAAYLMDTVTEPSCGSVGGEWAVIGLARAGCAVKDGYFEGYYDRLCETLRACGGVLDARKNTEYSRVILALTAIGKDPSDVAGYDLLLPLADHEQTLWQGLNGPIWALIALDCGAYPDPAPVEGAEPVNRETLVAELLSARCTDGGWTMMGDKAEVDITALALTALAPYTGEAAVQAAVDEALALLSDAQLPDGGFDCYGTENCESAAQVLVALTSLGIDPLTDSRFVKDGATVPDAVASFAVEGGGFRHIAEQTAPDNMATEQGFYALAACQRFTKGQSRLYDMTAVEQDRYQTDPVPEGKPQPVEPQDAQVDDTADCTCTISISCEVLLDNMDLCVYDKGRGYICGRCIQDSGKV